MEAGAELRELKRELRAAAEPERVGELQRFFKTGPGEYGEGDVFIGVRVPAIREIVASYATKLDLAEIGGLLDSGVHEERLAALLMMVRRFRLADGSLRNEIFEMYLRKTDRINGWDLVDSSAPHIVGAHLLNWSQARAQELLDRLIHSTSLWERRIALVATAAFIRQGSYDPTLRLAQEVLDDREDLIHKATGWMLREVGKKDEERLVAFLADHAARMPRTMLRYAVERLPDSVRLEMMSARRRTEDRMARPPGLG